MTIPLTDFLKIGANEHRARMLCDLADIPYRTLPMNRHTQPVWREEGKVLFLVCPSERAMRLPKPAGYVCTFCECPL